MGPSERLAGDVTEIKQMLTSLIQKLKAEGRWLTALTLPLVQYRFEPL
jgi:hypothetical protein